MSRADTEYFLDNLSMLAGSGLSIAEAIRSAAEDGKSRSMRRIAEMIRQNVEEGMPLWKALENTRLFSPNAISLLRIGEQTGKLADNLKVIRSQQEKDRIFYSKIRSAMLYPVFVLVLSLMIGIGISWFMLPKLALVFSQLHLDLPVLTKALIAIGTYLGQHGDVAIPGFAAFVIILTYILFYFSKTKGIGQALLLALPGIRGLMQEVEMARLGYFLGTLLESGMLVTQAVGSLIEATPLKRYRKFYTYLCRSLEEGNSFERSFDGYRRINRILPGQVRQLITTGEKAGNLPETLLSISRHFEAKTETTTKDLTVIFEPVLLVIVWLGVLAVALAVILPIYGLVGGLNSGSSRAIQTELPVEAVTPSESESGKPEEIIPEQNEEKQTLTILPTGTDYLNVRNDASRAGKIIGRVIPGETYPYSDVEKDWYFIERGEKESGWVSGEYVKKDVEEE